MAPTKILNINPDFFSLKQNNQSKTLKKEKKSKPTEVKSANSIRKALLAKIKDYQKKGEENKKSEKINNEKKEEEFESEFNKSLNFLQELSNKHKHKQNEKHKKTFKKQQIRSIEPIVNIDLPEALIENPNVNTQNVLEEPHNKPLIKHPSEIITSQPVISIDKQALNVSPKIIPSMPMIMTPIHIQTEFNSIPQHSSDINIQPIQTIEPKLESIHIDIPEIKNDIKSKEKVSFEQNIVNKDNNILNEIKNDTINNDLSNDIRKYRKKVLHNNSKITLKNPPPYSNLKGSNKPTFKEWNKTHKQYHTNQKVVIAESKPIKKKITKKYKTIKYNLGKKGKDIHVLIKNNNTRKKVKHELLKLKKKPILEVKDYLHQKNLIKAGTLAPNDVLREIYEQSILSGDIINENNQTLIHNFFNNKTDAF